MSVQTGRHANTLPFHVVDVDRMPVRSLGRRARFYEEFAKEVRVACEHAVKHDVRHCSSIPTALEDRVSTHLI